MNHKLKHFFLNLIVITTLNFLFFIFWLQAAEPGKNLKKCGLLYGLILDEETKEPVNGVQILLAEIIRSGMSHENGHFFIPEVPLGKFTLRTFRIGYQNIVQTVTINRCDTNFVLIKLHSSPLMLSTIEIAAADADNFEAIKKSGMVMEGKKLRQHLGKTLAETIANEPGLDQRTMGPAPARPVLRGLSGDRLLILEDGERTGDLSATSADHAVVIEPMTSDRIEVIRGPEALKYGSNTLGGVINVLRGYIPTTYLDHYHGTITYQGETVNKGSSGGFAVSGPVGPLSWRLDGSARMANDIQTPVGALKNTAIETWNGSLGLALARSWGYTGIAGSYYQSDYGIPGGFIGAHPNGVDINLERQHFETKTLFFLSNKYLKQIELEGNYTRYFHQEFESSGILGIEFGLLTYHLSLIGRLQEHGILKNGTFGLWSEHRDYASGGYSFTPATIERTLAGYYYQELEISRLVLQGAIRFDNRSVKPEHEMISKRIGRISRRTFGHYSAALAAIYQLFPNYYIDSRLMRSSRDPGIEELFSEGPHLAAYSFEVGNPELGLESGFGLEFFLRFTHLNGRIDLNFFRNDISQYIYPRNTGNINYRTLLPTYQFTGMDALLQGGELTFEYEIFHPLAISGTISYVHGDLTQLHKPLPWMPPLSGTFDIKYHQDKISTGITFHSAAKQNSLGEFEETTDGFFVIDLNFQYLFSIGPILSSLDFGIQNITNTEYRKHLSRVKTIMPEPGRNFKLLYRLYF